MGERSRLITLVIVLVAILAMVASYAAATVGVLSAAAPKESTQASPALANALTAPAAPVKSAPATHTVSAQFAKFGPRSTSGIPRTNSPKAAAPGCSGNCPMGITDYGLTASEASASYNYTFAQSFWDSGLYLGIGTANGGGCLDPDAESLVCFTLQQNLVTQRFYTNGGEYWTQNVPEVAYDSSCSSPCVSGTYSVTMLDNVWNFSYSGGVCPSGKDTGKGCINPARIVGDGESDCVGGTGGAPEFYYCVGPTIYNITLPFTITAATNINYNGCASGDNCVYFYDSIQVGTSVVFGGYFDAVTFHFVDQKYKGAPDADYLVKYAGTPLGLPYDDEWIFGGPGGGSGNVVATYGDLQSFNCFSSCYYQTSWHSIKNAWSSGYDTAEYVFDVYVIPEFNYRDAAELYFAADDSGTYIF